ncbi:leukotoxin LktA family filamentous adhesin, partial [Anaerospora hongkongensis]
MQRKWIRAWKRGKPDYMRSAYSIFRTRRIVAPPKQLPAKRTWHKKVLPVAASTMLGFLPFLYSLSDSIVYAEPQIITDGRTGTSLAINGSITDITTSTIKGVTGFNSFDRFNVYANNTVNLYLPGGTSNLLNLVHGERSYIDGMLNSIKDGKIGGNVYFLNSYGTVVGTTGTMNVGSLTMMTPTKSFMNNFFDNTGALNQVFDGTVPLDAQGQIVVKGKISAIDDVTLRAGTVVNEGTVATGSVFKVEKPDFSQIVNITNIQDNPTLAIKNGNIVISAVQEVSISGNLLTTGPNSTKAGDITISVNSGETAKIGITGGNIEGNNITLTASVQDTTTGIVGLKTSEALVDVSGGMIKASGDVAMTASSDVKVTTKIEPGPEQPPSEGNAAAAITKVDSSAEVHIHGNSSLDVSGNLSLHADNKVEVTSIADGSGSSAGASVALSKIVSDTSVIVDENAVINQAAAITLEASSSNVVNTTATASTGGAANAPNQTLNDYQDDAKTSEGSVTAAGSLAINDISSTTRAYMASSQTANSSGKVEVVSSALNKSTVTADGSTVAKDAAGIGAAVGINKVNSVNEAHIDQEVSAKGVTVSANNGEDTSVFDTTAVSGAGSDQIGVAGALAVNKINHKTAAVIGEGASITSNDGDISISAENRATETAKALPNKNALQGGDLGIGASVALNLANNITTAELKGAITGAHDISVSALGKHTLVTEAEAGAAGGFALTPVVALTVADNITTAKIASGPDLNVTGDVSVSADNTGSTKTSATGSAEGNAAIGAAIAVNVITDSAEATTARSISAGGDVSFTAKSSSTVEANAIAGAKGGKQDEKGAAVKNDSTEQGGVDQAIAEQTAFGQEQKNGKDTEKKEAKSASTSEGKLSVAAAVGVNVAENSARAYTADGVNISGKKLTAKAEQKTVDKVSADGNSEIAKAPVKEGETAPTPTGTGIGAGVAINSVSALADAHIGKGTHHVTGVEVAAKTLNNEASQFTAEAISGASGGNVGLAGSFALNSVENTSTASIDKDAEVNGTAADVNVEATNQSEYKASATPGKTTAGAGLGIGASVAMNLADNITTAQIEGKVTGAHDVTVSALGDHTLVTEAKAGAAGGFAATPVVALTVADNVTTAKIASGADLAVSGDVSVSADNTGSTKTSATGSAEGNAAIGAAIAVNVITDSAEATTARSINAGGDVSFTAKSSSTVEANAVAGAKGGKQDDKGAAVKNDSTEQGGVDQAIAEQTAFGQEQKNGKDTEKKEAKSASTSEGKLSVAAAVGVNVADNSARAYTADGVNISGKKLTAKAEQKTVDKVSADGNSEIAKAPVKEGETAPTPTGTGIGAGVAINSVTALADAHIGKGTHHVTGLEVAATALNNEASQFTAEAISGASGGNVGLAGSFALNSVENTSTASIDKDAEVNGTAADVNVEATNQSEYKASATPGKTTAGAGLGIGASVAMNLADNITTAQIEGKVTGAHDVSVSALGNHTLVTEAEAGAAGGFALTPVVALTVADNVTTAKIASGTDLDVSGDVSVNADNTGSTKTSATGSAEGNAAIGAAIAVNVITDSAEATTARSISAGGDVSLTAKSNSTVEASAIAGAKGGKQDEKGAAVKNDAAEQGGVDQAIAEQTAFGQEQKNGKDAEKKEAKSASTSEGKLSVAAAVGVNVAENSARAYTSDGVNISGKKLTAKAEQKTVAQVKADGNSEIAKVPVKEGEQAPTPTGTGIGAGVAINSVTALADAHIGKGTHHVTGVEVAAKALNGEASQFTAEAISGASGGNVGLAGSFALNSVENTSTASIDEEAEINGTAADIKVEARNQSKYKASATPGKTTDGAGLGIGASVAMNLADNITTAQIEGKVTGAHDVSVSALGNHTLVTEAKTGAAGGFALTPVVGLTVADNITTAKIASGTDLVVSGDVSVSADNTGSTTTSATGSAEGNAAIGAALAVNVITDSAEATTARSISAGGDVSFTAKSNSTVEANAIAGAKGGKQDEKGAAVKNDAAEQGGVDQAIAEQTAFGQEQKNGKDAEKKEAKSASTSEGKLSVAAAVGVNVAENSARAYTADGVNISGKKLTAKAEQKTVDKVSADGNSEIAKVPVKEGETAPAPTGTGIGAGVAINSVSALADAHIGKGTHHVTGVEVAAKALNDEASEFTAEAISGASGGNVGLAGSFALNSVENTSTASIDKDAEINGTAADVNVEATNQSEYKASATPGKTTAGAGLGIGASVAMNLADNITTAQIEGKVTGAHDVSVSALGDHTLVTEAKAGAAGGFAATPVVALTVADNVTTAKIASGADLAVSGDVSVSADNTGSTKTSATGSAEGNAAIGAALAVNVITDSAEATTARSISAGGDVSFTAKSNSTVEASAVAGAKGGKQDEKGAAVKNDSAEAGGVDQAIAEQTAFGQEQKNGKDAEKKEAKSASTSEGKLSVAAAVGVNVAENSARAYTSDGVNISGKKLTAKAEQKTVAQVKADGNSEIAKAPVKEGEQAPAPTGTGIGAGVAINSVSAVADAHIGKGTHHVTGLEVAAKALNNEASQFTAEAISGASGGNVGLAGSFALNSVENTSTASIDKDAEINGTAADVNVEATNQSEYKASATPGKTTDGAGLGIGASVAMNLADNITSATIAGKVTGAHDVSVSALGDHTLVTEAEAGAAGGFALTPVVGLTVADNITTAKITSGPDLDVTGTVSVSADNTGNTTTSAKGAADGAKAAIGAAVAINIANDKAFATTGRNITAGGDVIFHADNQSRTEANAIASAAGGTPAKDDGSASNGKNVDSLVKEQTDFAQKEKTEKKEVASAQTSEGKLAVAAAVGVNLSDSSAVAVTPDGVTIKAGGKFGVIAANETDAKAAGDGSAGGNIGKDKDGKPVTSTASIGIGAGVAINTVTATTSATIGAADHEAGSVEVKAIAHKEGDIAQSSDFTAEAISGAAGGKVGLAGSFALNSVTSNATAEIKDGATIAVDNAGSVTIEAENRTTREASATPTEKGATGGSVGLGASVALNIGANSALAKIAGGADVTGAGAVSLAAMGVHTIHTKAEAGSAGGIALTPVVAMNSVDNQATAIVEKRTGSAEDVAENLLTVGSLSVSATNSATGVTEAKGAADGSKAAIGAAVAINIANDRAFATTGRNITAGGDVVFHADNQSKTEANAIASAAGGTPAKDDGSASNGKNVDSLVKEQTDFAQKDKTEKKEAASAQTSEGKLGVAAAVGVNLSDSSAVAVTPDGVTIKAGGKFGVTAANETDAKASGDGSAGGRIGTDKDGKPVTSTASIGIGAGVAINTVTATTSASIGAADHEAGSVEVQAIAHKEGDSAQSSDFTAEAVSGAAGGKVGLAGSFALNSVTSNATAEIKDGATIAVDPNGSVTIEAENRTTRSASATPQGKGATGGSLGMGASVALNLGSNSALAKIAGGADVTGAGDVSLAATGVHTISTKAEAGASGGIALTPVVAMNSVDNQATAIVEKRTGSAEDVAENLLTVGSLHVSAANSATGVTEAKGAADGSKAAIGAAVAINIANDRAFATTGRNITAEGNVVFSADNQSKTEANAIASAAGGTPAKDDGSASNGKNVDSLVKEQTDFAQKDKTEKKEAASAQTSEGKLAVAAAVGVNLSDSSAVAVTPDGVTIKAGGKFGVTAANETDAKAAGDGSAGGRIGTDKDGKPVTSTASIGIGAGVAINTVTATTSASIGAADHEAGSVEVQAIAHKEGDSAQSSDFTAEAVSGAAGGKVGLAGSFALNSVTSNATAEIKDGATIAVDPNGSVTIEAENRTTRSASATPQGKGATGGSLGMGASVALNLGSNSALAKIAGGADVTGAGDVSLAATGVHTITT